MKKQERLNRIIARGEHSNHSHVVVGDAAVTRNDNGQVIVEVGNEGAVLRHILESNWMNGEEVWTGEHEDIKLDEGTYRYVAQIEFDPFKKHIKVMMD